MKPKVNKNIRDNIKIDSHFSNQNMNVSWDQMLKDSQVKAVFDLKKIDRPKELVITKKNLI